MPTSETPIKFARLLLPVRDMDLMSAFYRDVIGFSQVESEPSADVCFDAGGLLLCLRTTMAPMRDDQTLGPIVIFNTPDVALMREQLIEQGVQIGKLKSFGSLSECEGHDPEGNVFRLSNQG